MSKWKEVISILMVLCVCFISVSAEQITSANTTSVQSDLMVDYSEYTLEKAPAFLLEQIQSATASSGQEPVSLAMDNANHLSSFTVENADGTLTVHQYLTDIKFIDTDNKVKFKDNTLVPSEKSNGLFSTYAYENKQNNIKSYFPKNIYQGLRLEYEDIIITMKPTAVQQQLAQRNSSKTLLKAEAAELAVDYEGTDVVEYNNVFGPNTSVQYAPSWNGIKENIVLEAYTGQNVFQFDLNLGDLTPKQLEGGTLGLQNDAGEDVASIGQIFVTDSYDGDETVEFHSTLNNTQKLEKLDNSGNYRLSVTVDKEFLEDESTVYPVVIDPSVSVISGYLWDTSVYSSRNRSPNPYYQDQFALVGTGLSSSAYGTLGEGRYFVNWKYIEHYMYLNPTSVNSVYYRVREGSGNTTSSSVKIYQVKQPFDQTQITFSHPLGTQISTATLVGSGYYSLNITTAFRDWLKYEMGLGGYDQTCGFAITGSSVARHFQTANSSTNPPSFVINFTADTSVPDGSYCFLNKNSNKYIDVNGNSTVDGANVHQYQSAEVASQCWNVKSVGTGVYKITSVNSDKALHVNSSSTANGGNIIQYTYNNWDAQKWRIVKNPDNTTYRIVSVVSGLAVDVQGGSTTNAANIMQYEFRNTDNQKWTLQSSAVIETFTDDAYDLRYSGSTTSQLYSYNTIVKNLFKSIFNIRLICLPAYVSYSTCADLCQPVTSSSINSQCFHYNNLLCGAENNLYHHKNIWKICGSITSIRTIKPGYIPVTWTGHVVCQGGCYKNNYSIGATGGTLYPKSADNQTMYYMVISNTAAPGSQALASHAVTAFGHELGHAFGAMSNLVDTNHGENCVMSRDCKMDKIYGSAVEGKTIFCTSCASQITSKTVS